MPSLRQWDGAQWLDIGVQSLDDLTDADTTTTAPANGDGLVWNGTNWVPQAPAAGTVLPTAGAGLTGGAASYDVGAGTGITVAADAISLDQAHTDALYVNTTGDTMTGNLNISVAGILGIGPVFVLDTTPGHLREIYGRTNNVLRWNVIVGSNEAESGANAGSNFSINNYTDAGVYLGTPLKIERATGTVSFEKPVVLVDPVPTIPTHAASKQYVDQAVAGAAPVEEVVVGGIVGPADPNTNLWMDTNAPDPTVALEERVRVLEDLVASLTGGAS